MSYEIVFAIVNRGFSQSVIEAANLAGAQGATVVQARGGCDEETHIIFSQPSNPEKEIILILIAKVKTQSVIKAIENDLQQKEAGKWVIFVTDVSRTAGLFTGKK